jgi:hypothetical protein
MRENENEKVGGWDGKNLNSNPLTLINDFNRNSLKICERDENHLYQHFRLKQIDER